MTAPSFAGLTALLNQALGSGGVGNANPKLYALAQAGWASGMFHDITTGNNIVTVACTRRDPNCGATPVGYSAGAGYDQATGLGSVDAYKLVMGWTGNALPAPTASVTLLSNLSTVATNDVVYLTATATAANGVTPAGVGFVFDRRDLAGSGYFDRFGRFGNRDAGGERLPTAAGYGNNYRDLQRRQQHAVDGKCNVRIGSNWRACHHRRNKRGQLQVKFRARLYSERVPDPSSRR